MQSSREIRIIGHRGAAGHAPENTEAAILAGLRLGANAIEVDVQFTSDGHAVVFHDRTLERMAGVRGRIRDQSARDLAGYDIGFRFGDDHRGLRILAIEEAAALVPREVELHVEIKEYDPVSSAHLQDLLAALRRRGGIERCLFSSFGEKILSSLRAIDGRARLGLLVSGKALHAVDRAAELACESVHTEAGETGEDLVRACHAAGRKVYPYTANEVVQLRHLLEIGVDGIYTDFPGRLADILEGIGQTRRISFPQPVAEIEPAPIEPGSARPRARRPRRGGGEPPRSGRRREPRGRRPPRHAPGEPPPEQPRPEPVKEAAPEAAPVEPSAAPEGGGPEGLKKKRRRGRRGGRRHRGGRRPGGEGNGGGTPS
jgi:glycerophosphoryl diester phosphodiesterase